MALSTSQNSKDKAHPLSVESFYSHIMPHVHYAGYHKASSDWISPDKSIQLKSYDLWFVFKGKGSVKLDNKWFEFQPWQLVSIKPQTKYQKEMANPNDPFEVYFIHLDLFPKISVSQRMIHQLNTFWPTLMNLQPEISYDRYFSELFETFTAKPINAPLKINYLAMTILDHIFACLLLPASDGTVAYQKVNMVRRYIEQNYALDDSLDILAERVDLSASYLLALFKHHYRCTPIQFRIQCRFNQAKILLAKGHTVLDAAEQTGFQSQHYFTRLFQKHFGQSPTQFKKTFQRFR